MADVTGLSFVGPSFLRHALPTTLIRGLATPPNAATRRAMAELEQGKGERFDSAEGWFEALGS